MQKKIIALAVAGLMSGAAFATNVTISGTLDESIVNQKTDYNGVAGVTQTNIGSGNQSTSHIKFTATEDLGGGMKAVAVYSPEFDASVNAGGWSNTGESYVALAGGFGTVALGTINTTTLAVQAMRQPFATKIGGGYNTTLGTAFTRAPDTAAYVSPSFGGFNFTLAHVFGAATDNTATTAVAPAATMNEVGLKYAAGPLSVGYSRFQVGEVSTLATGASVKQNNLGVSYSFGSFKLMGGYGTQKNELNAATTVDQKNWNIAADVTVAPNMNVLFNYGKMDDKLAVNRDRNIYAVGLKYALSKRTSAYARYVNDDLKNPAAAGTDKITTTLFGVQHSF